MSSDINFVSVIGFDIVRSADPRIPGQILKERKKAFRNCLHDSKTYQTLLHYANEIDTGDGEFFIVDTKDSAKLLDIVKELQKNLEEHNESVKDPNWHVMIRTGINVGPAEVKQEGKKITYTSGNAIDYTKRIMDIGQDNHILLTSSAVTTILAIDHTYHDKIQYIGEYPSKHGEKFNVHNYFDKDIGNPKNPPKHDLSLDGVNDELRKKIENEIKEKYESEIKEHKEENTKYVKKLKKQIKTYVTLSVAVISIISVTLLLSTSMIADEYEQKILEKEINSVNSIISHNIQTSIDTSKLIEVILINEFDSSGKEVSDFIDQIDNDKEFVIYTKNFNYPYISAYHHLMKPSNHNCEFVQYAYEETMERPNGSSLESCTAMNDVAVFLSSVLPSTGTNDFVVGLARTINFDLNDTTPFDLIATVAIDLTKLSQEIKNSIDSENVRFILEDRGNTEDKNETEDSSGYIVFDCDSQKCYVDYEKHTLELSKSKEGFNKDSKPIRYEENDYSDYKKYSTIEFSKDNDGLKLVDPNDSKILIGWKLHVFYK